MRIRHTPKAKEGDTRIKTRFAYIPVTCRASREEDTLETRWLEKVTTHQELCLVGFEESLATLEWVDRYFLDEQ